MKANVKASPPHFLLIQRKCLGIGISELSEVKPFSLD